MGRNDPAFVREYLHPYPWHTVQGYLRREPVGAFLFLAGTKRARHYDQLKQRHGAPLTDEELQAKAGGDAHLASIMKYDRDDSMLAIGMVTEAGLKKFQVPVEHVRTLGTLAAFVADMQRGGLPVDITKAVPYVNMYAPVFDDDE